MKDELFNVIERLANLLRQETRAAGQGLGLQPVQQEALYYLSTCNRYSDTTLAVTEYLGLTKGTVSQSLKVLENKSLIIRKKDDNDKRITHLKVTPTGSAFLAETCPPAKFSQAVIALSEKEQSEATVLLTGLLRSYQTSTERTAFGVCKNCQYNHSSADGIVCGLTNEALSIQDTRLICREFSTSTKA